MIKKPFTGSKKLVLLGTSVLLSASLMTPAFAADDAQPSDAPKTESTTKAIDERPVRIMVNYVDEAGNTIAPSAALRGDMGDPYNIQTKSLDGYKLVATVGDTLGVIDQEMMTVTFTYEDIDPSTPPPSKPDPVDDKAPAVPVVSDVAVSATAITGTAEAGAVVTVTISSDVVLSAVAGPTGAFSVAVPESVTLKKDAKLTVTARDAAGNVSASKDVIVIEKAATPSDSDVLVRAVVKHVDKAGKQIAPDQPLAGKVGDAYTTFPYVIDGYKLSKNDGKTSGVFGKELVTVMYTYDVIEKADTTAPTAPVVNSYVVGSDVVTGNTEANATVSVVFPNGVVKSATASSAGVFRVTLPSGLVIKTGDKLSVTSIDAAGNVSSARTLVALSEQAPVDTTAPNAPVVNAVKATDKDITGTAEAGSTVNVTFAGGKTATAIAFATGAYRVALPTGVTLKANDAVMVVATDAAGNVSQATTFTVPANAVTPDTAAPVKPVVNPFNVGDKFLTGVAEIGSTITVVFKDGKTASTVVKNPEVKTAAEPTAEFSVAIPAGAVNEGDALVVTSRDAAGNVSSEKIVRVAGTGDATPVPVPDVTPVTPAPNEPDTQEPVDVKPAPPKVNFGSMDDDEDAVTGTAEPGTTIQVTLPNGKKVTGKTGADGKFSVPFPADYVAKVGDEFLVNAIDEQGNVSDTTMFEMYAVDSNGNKIDAPIGTPIAGNIGGTTPPPIKTTPDRAGGNKAAGDNQTVDPDRDLKAIPQASAETNWWMIFGGLGSLVAAGYMALTKRRERTE